jgi:hypothetical protein
LMFTSRSDDVIMILCVCSLGRPRLKEHLDLVGEGYGVRC